MISMEVDTFQQQALEFRPIDNFDPSSEPKSGEEFLQKVIFERNKCPAIVVKLPKKAKVVPAVSVSELNGTKSVNDISPVCLKPTIEWKGIQVEDFIKTRNKINNLRQHLEAHNYSTENEFPLSDEDTHWEEFCRSTPPLLSIILRINQRALEQLLEFESEWLRANGEDNVDKEPELQEKGTPLNDENIADPADALSTTALPVDLSGKDEWLGSWLYSTLACLRLPLEPDIHSVLRDIARTCIRLRNKLGDKDVTQAVPYNLFICIICKVFDQLDLSEFV